MASNELIIDDDYCRAMGSYFTKQGEELDQLIVDYISILQDVKNKGIRRYLQYDGYGLSGAYLYFKYDGG